MLTSRMYSATISRAASYRPANSEGGDALVFRSDFTAKGMKIKLRNVTRASAADKISSEEYITKEGSPEVLMVRVDAKKRP